MSECSLIEAAAGDPAGELAELHAAVDGTADLRTMLLRVADHLLRRSQRVMLVLRGALMAGSATGTRDRTHVRGSAPRFMIEANRALMSGLTDLFEPHRGDLGVEPEVAATVLRTLVLGTRHPGAHSDYLLTPDEVADVMLGGILRRAEGGE